MSKDQMQNEIRYQLSKELLARMLFRNLITEEEYNQINSLNLKTFQPAETKLYEKNSRCVTEKQVSFAWKKEGYHGSKTDRYCRCRNKATKNEKCLCLLQSQYKYSTSERFLWVPAGVLRKHDPKQSRLEVRRHLCWLW